MKSKIALLQKTNMVDFAMDIYKDLYQVSGARGARSGRSATPAAAARRRPHVPRPKSRPMQAPSAPLPPAPPPCRPPPLSPPPPPSSPGRPAERGGARGDAGPPPGGGGQPAPAAKGGGPHHLLPVQPGGHPQLPTGPRLQRPVLARGVRPGPAADRRAVPVRQVPVRLRQLQQRGGAAAGAGGAGGRAARALVGLLPCSGGAPGPGAGTPWGRCAACLHRQQPGPALGGSGWGQDGPQCSQGWTARAACRCPSSTTLLSPPPPCCSRACRRTSPCAPAATAT